MSACEEFPLDDDALAEVADRRARGQPWDAVAGELGWDTAALRRAVRRAPDFDRAYERAAREVRAEAEAEVLAVFRTGLRDADPDRRQKAAEGGSRHLAAERRDRTRVEVETLRAAAARAKAEAKRAKGEEQEEEHVPPVTEQGPDEVHDVEREERLARRAADDKAVVWLWGGEHKVGNGTGPDAATDVPLVLFPDGTVRGAGRLYWAVRYPLPGDPINGPVPVPSQEPVPELTPEQVAQLHALDQQNADPPDGSVG